MHDCDHMILLSIYVYHQVIAYLCNWSWFMVYEEASVAKVSAGCVVWHWLSKVLACVVVQKQTCGMRVLVHIFLNDSHPLSLLCT